MFVPFFWQTIKSYHRLLLQKTFLAVRFDKKWCYYSFDDVCFELLDILELDDFRKQSDSLLRIVASEVLDLRDDIFIVCWEKFFQKNDCVMSISGS